MELTTVWFVLVAVLWTGYFALEGFDFGIGMLLPVLARDDRERRVMINTIGPVWDGNEVWVLVAVGATFAAFPEWYASLLSGFYLPLLAVLVALIVRGLAFEYRHQRDDALWQARWDRALIWGSLVPAFVWGAFFANVVRGVPMDADAQVTGSVLALVNPYALLGGLTTLLLFATHGAVFTALKTDGEIRYRARSLALRLGVSAGAVGVVFGAWTQLATGTTASGVALVVAALAFAAGLVALTAGREGWAFTGTFAAIALLVAGLFLGLFPDVLPSTTDPAFSLTTTSAAASPYTLEIITWVAAFFTPLVVAYQAWSYWVFRKRISVHHIPVAAH